MSPQVSFDWEIGLITNYARDYVSTRWYGKLLPSTGEYTLYLFAADDMRLWIDHKLVTYNARPIAIDGVVEPLVIQAIDQFVKEPGSSVAAGGVFVVTLVGTPHALSNQAAKSVLLESSPNTDGTCNITFDPVVVAGIGTLSAVLGLPFQPQPNAEFVVGVISILLCYFCCRIIISSVQRCRQVMVLFCAWSHVLVTCDTAHDTKNIFVHTASTLFRHNSRVPTGTPDTIF
jgi:hypothetical protein